MPVPDDPQYVVLCDADKLSADSGIPNLVAYETWIGGQRGHLRVGPASTRTRLRACATPAAPPAIPKAAPLQPSLDHPARLCAACRRDVPVGARSVLPVVPMFHVNAWGIPYSAALTGCKLVFPGRRWTASRIYELIEAEKVTYAAGVPTVWQMLLGHMKPDGCASPRSSAR
jgi:fatty-acyl-CoA synthase